MDAIEGELTVDSKGNVKQRDGSSMNMDSQEDDQISSDNFSNMKDEEEKD